MALNPSISSSLEHLVLKGLKGFTVTYCYVDAVAPSIKAKSQRYLRALAEYTLPGSLLANYRRRGHRTSASLERVSTE